MVRPGSGPALKLVEKAGEWFLELNAGLDVKTGGPLVTSELLGRTAVSGMAFKMPDGSPIRLDRDYSGDPHAAGHPRPGPFGGLTDKAVRAWPVAGRR